MNISLSISYVAWCIKSVWTASPKVINILSRPKVVIDVKNQTIFYRDSSGDEHHKTYPCLIISFKKDVKVDVRSIQLNNESLISMLGKDPLFLQQNTDANSPIIILNNRLMVFAHKNWSQLAQRTCQIDVNRHEREVLPINIQEGVSHFIFLPKKKPGVFFSTRKVVLSLSIDGSQYDYGIPLISFCKVIINNLAFKGI